MANDPSGPSAISALRYAAADGTGGTLRLRFAGRPTGTPAIAACRVTGSWTPAANGPMSSAPSYDCSDGVAAVVAPDMTTVSWRLPATFASSGSLDVALVPARGAGVFQAAFQKPGADSFLAEPAAVPEETAPPVAAPEPAPVPGMATDTGPPAGAPASATLDLPPVPEVAPPPAPADSVQAPVSVPTPTEVPVPGEAAFGNVGFPQPRLVGGSRADQILGFSLLAAVGVALWLLSGRPASAPRLIGGARRAPAVATAPVRAEAGPRIVRVGGIGRFARPRTTLPHRL